MYIYICVHITCATLSADLLRQPLLSISKLSSSSGSGSFIEGISRTRWEERFLWLTGLAWGFHDEFVAGPWETLGKPRENDHFYLYGSEMVNLPKKYGHLNRENYENLGYARFWGGFWSGYMFGNSLRTVPVV